MNRIEPQRTPNRRSKRVVTLPCGHQVDVDLDASMLAVSGPVLNHQATCHPERPPAFAAWFAVGPLPKWEPDSLAPRPAALANVIG
jgi:hypothetical protein